MFEMVFILLIILCCFHQNADIGLGAISVMDERERVIDFTYPFYEGVGILIILLKTPNPPNIFT